MSIDPFLYSALKDLTPHWQELAAEGVLRRFAKGKALIREGDRSPAIYILLSGSVHATASRPNGQSILFASYRAGEVFGVLSMDGGPWLSSVVATEAVQCLVIPRDRVEGHLKEHPELHLELLMGAIDIARRVTAAAKKLAFLDVYGRMISYFNELAGESPQFPLEFTGLTHRQIAARIGASRVMVSRLLKDLEKGDYLEIKTRRLYLKRPLPKKW